ncbi:MAG TPA: hypothetical protein VN364_13950 [Bellilinea sp.]|nr:hypothetical protein [Bellilinea sp.]
MSEKTESPNGDPIEKPEDKQFSDLLNKSLTISDEIDNFVKTVSSRNQTNRVYAMAMRDALPVLSKFEYPPELLKLLADSNEVRSRFVMSVDENLIMDSTGGTILATATTAYSGAMPSMREAELMFPVEQFQLVVENINLFNSRVSRPELKEETSQLLIKWGFDVGAHNDKSPLELFTTAHTAFERPISNTNPAITSLIPIRSCIELVIGRLKELRPKTPNAKGIRDIILIGDQLKSDLLDNSIVKEWDTQWRSLSDDLSPAKYDEMNYDEWRKLLFDATRFLHSFLDGLDNTKARQPK